MTTVNLNYKTVGRGEPVVILHGLFGSLDNWQSIARELSESGFQIVTVDLRNHGKSPHTDEMNHQIMAEDVKKLIVENSLQACTLVGHSMGGKTAMQLAFSYPELLSKLVVVDISPKPYAAHHNQYFDAMLGLDVNKIENRRDAQEKLGEKIRNQAILQFLLKNLDRSKDGYNWKFNLHSLHKNYNTLISGIQTAGRFEKPSLFIGGQLSDYISRSDEAEIKQLFPNSEIIMIPKSGHWVHAEQPELFKQALTRFLNS